MPTLYWRFQSKLPTAFSVNTFKTMLVVAMIDRGVPHSFKAVDLMINFLLTKNHCKNILTRTTRRLTINAINVVIYLNVRWANVWESWGSLHDFMNILYDLSRLLTKIQTITSWDLVWQLSVLWLQFYLALFLVLCFVRQEHNTSTYHTKTSTQDHYP